MYTSNGNGVGEDFLTADSLFRCDCFNQVLKRLQLALLLFDGETMQKHTVHRCCLCVAMILATAAAQGQVTCDSAGSSSVAIALHLPAIPPQVRVVCRSSTRAVSLSNITWLNDRLIVSQVTRLTRNPLPSPALHRRTCFSLKSTALQPPRGRLLYRQLCQLR